MRTSLIILPLLAACATSAEEGPLVDPLPLEDVFGTEQAEAVDARRSVINLAVLGTLTPGVAGTIEVTGAGAGETIHVAFSLTGVGVGSCPAILGGQCLDLTGSVNLLGSATADANGVAQVVVNVPATTPVGTQLHLQAFAIRGVGGSQSVVSPPVSSTVGGVGTTDDFVHFPAAVDVLFVIDDSCSMIDEQNALTGSFQPMIDAILDLGLDYHVGVVSTDMVDPSKSGQLQPSTSGSIWIDPSDPNPTTTFTQMASLGTAGSAYEEGLMAMTQALGVHATGANLGFRRATAQLAVVVLSDEDDQSSGTAQDHADVVTGQILYTGDASFSSIVEPANGCPTGAGPGLRYLDVTAIVGGWSTSICASDYSPLLTAMTGDLWTSVPYSLSQTPDPATIEIVADEVGGSIVLSNTDWVYDAAQNTVRFTSAYHPPSGTDVHVTYTVQ